jgi:hypothetical protein
MAGAGGPMGGQPMQPMTQPVTGNIPDYTRLYIDNMLRQRPQQPGQNPYVDYTNPGQPMPQPGSNLIDAIRNAGSQPMPQPYRPALQPIARPVQQPRGPADRNMQPVTTQGLAGLAGMLQGRQ